MAFRFNPLTGQFDLVLNTDTDGTLAANSDGLVPTQKAVKTYADTKVPATRTVNGHALSADVTVTKGDVGLGSVTNDAQLKAADLDTDGTLAANSDSKIASQKATKTYADTKLPSSYLDTDGTLAANSDVKVPSQKAVKTYADQLIAANDAMVFKGVIDASSNPNYPAADRGHTYKISVAGKIGGASGVNVEVGDLIICITDGTASGNQATVGANWVITQTNLDGAVIGPASVTDGNPTVFDGTSGKLIKQVTFSAFKTSLALTKSDVGLGNVTNDAQLKAADLDTDGTLAANSDTKIASQKATKTYADTKVPKAISGLSAAAAVADADLVPTDQGAGALKQTFTAIKTWIKSWIVKADVGLGSVDNTADSAKNVLSATKLTTARNIDGQSFDGSASITVIAPGTHAATGKTTPVDADELPIVDSEASNVLKKLTFANLKAWVIAFITGYTKPVGYYWKLFMEDASATSITLQFASMVFTDGSIVPFETKNGSYTIDATTTGVNGLDKGVRVNDLWVHIYAIAKTDGTTAGMISPIINGSGSGATVSYTAAAGVITAVTATPPAGGTGYRKGEIVRVSSGDGTALIRVATIGANGAVATWSTNPSYGGAASYTTATGQATTTTPTLPTGYTIMRKVGSAYYTSNAFRGFTKRDTKFEYKPNVPANSSGNLAYVTSQTEAFIGDVIPMSALRHQFMMQLGTAAVNDLYFQVNDTSTAGAFISWAYCIAGHTMAFQIEVPVLTPQTIWYLNATAGSITVQRVYMKWWEDTID